MIIMFKVNDRIKLVCPIGKLPELDDSVITNPFGNCAATIVVFPNNVVTLIFASDMNLSIFSDL